MDNRRGLMTALATALLILGLVIGWVAFRLGQQTTDVADEVSLNASPLPPTLATSPPPLPVVTNTPTRLPSPTATPLPSPTATPSPSPTPIVVITHVKSLGRLETTEFAMRTVVDLQNDPSNLWQQLVGSDKLMLVAEGEVVAGFDFEKIRPADISVAGTSVTIILPAPEILYSRIDNEKTQVYERQTGLFVAPDQTLESRARQVAEEALVEWAIERDIFEQANRDGRLQIENLLRSLGFTNITIQVREPEL